MVERLRAFVDSDSFRSPILALIVLNALAMGVEATPILNEQYADWLDWIFTVSQVVFVIEIVLRVATYWPQPARFFDESWNRFDFVIVALSLLPMLGAFALIARVFRVLRILRVVTAFGSIRGSFLREEPGLRALAPALLLLALIWYAFALVGFHLFGEALPDTWGSLGRAFASLARLFTASGLTALSHTPVDMGLIAFAVVFLLVMLTGAINLIRALVAGTMPSSEASP